MGILKIVTKAAEILAPDAVDAALEKSAAALEKAAEKVDAASKNYEAKAQKQLTDFFASNPTHALLYMVQERGKLRQSYYIFDATQQPKYFVRGELLSKKHHLHIYDPSGKIEIGFVKEKLIAMRGPLSMEGDPKNFSLQINGKEIGTMKTKYAFGKRKFVFDFNDWEVEGDFFGRNYTVQCEKETIMTVKQKGFAGGDRYFLDITNPPTELLCVLIAVAIDAAEVSKHQETAWEIEQRKQAIKRAWNSSFP